MQFNMKRKDGGFGSIHLQSYMARQVQLKGIDIVKSWPGPEQKYNLDYLDASGFTV